MSDVEDTGARNIRDHRPQGGRLVRDEAPSGQGETIDFRIITDDTFVRPSDDLCYVKASKIVTLTLPPVENYGKAKWLVVKNASPLLPVKIKAVGGDRIDDTTLYIVQPSKAIQLFSAPSTKTWLAV